MSDPRLPRKGLWRWGEGKPENWRPSHGVPPHLRIRAESRHPGYRVADAHGTVFLLPQKWPQWEYEVAEREASAAGGIVVRADWKAAELAEPLKDDVPVAGMSNPQEWLEAPKVDGIQGNNLPPKG